VVGEVRRCAPCGLLALREEGPCARGLTNHHHDAHGAYRRARRVFSTEIPMAKLPAGTRRWQDERESTHQGWCVMFLRQLGFDEPIFLTDGSGGTARGTGITPGEPDISHAFHTARGFVLFFECKPPAAQRRMAQLLSGQFKPSKYNLKEYRRARAQARFATLARAIAARHGAAICYGNGSVPELAVALLTHFTADELRTALRQGLIGSATLRNATLEAVLVAHRNREDEDEAFLRAGQP
jgi:hypothetical protein